MNRNKLRRQRQKKLKLKCQEYGKDPAQIVEGFFQKKPHPIPKGAAKIERQLKGQMVLKRDPFHVVTLQRNLINKSIGERQEKNTPNRMVLVTKFFNDKDKPKEHLCYKRFDAVLGFKRYKNKPRKLA